MSYWLGGELHVWGWGSREEGCSPICAHHAAMLRRRDGHACNLGWEFGDVSNCFRCLLGAELMLLSPDCFVHMHVSIACMFPVATVACVCS